MAHANTDLEKQFEGCETKLPNGCIQAYWDPYGKCWTIGWGYTGGEVHDGLIWTQEFADMMLEHMVNDRFAPVVQNMLARPATQGQFDALVDFAYNEGAQELRTSTLLKKFNAGDIQGAADEFLRWDLAGGQVLPGLENRRKAERERFLS